MNRKNSIKRAGIFGIAGNLFLLIIKGTVIDSTTQDIILNLAQKYTNIKKIDNISSSPVGYKYVVFITICVDGNMSTFDSHKLADNLEKDICGLDKVYKAIVHVNPI